MSRGGTLWLIRCLGLAVALVLCSCTIQKMDLLPIYLSSPGTPPAATSQPSPTTRPATVRDLPRIAAEIYEGLQKGKSP